MKALSVQQPWAWAIIHNRKDIENRTWKTSFRGTVAIHASLKLQPDAEMPARRRTPRPDELLLGYIIGVAELVDVVEESDSIWFGGPYGFLLKNPRPLAKPIACKGKLGLWEVPPDLERKIRKQLKLL